MHAETLAYMLHQLPLHRKVPHKESLNILAPPVAHRSIDIPAGSVTLGLGRDDGLFGWDNEYEAHRVDVPPFTVDQSPVTNRQYPKFIHPAAHDNPSFLP